MGSDVHVYAAFSHAFKEDSYPLEEEDLTQFGFVELLLSETAFLLGRAPIFDQYKTREFLES